MESINPAENLFSESLQTALGMNINEFEVLHVAEKLEKAPKVVHLTFTEKSARSFSVYQLSTIRAVWNYRKKKVAQDTFFQVIFT